MSLVIAARSVITAAESTSTKSFLDVRIATATRYKTTQLPISIILLATGSEGRSKAATMSKPNDGLATFSGDVEQPGCCGMVDVGYLLHFD